MYIFCGWDHTLAIDCFGKVLSWGAGQNGKLGHGSEENYAIPCYISAFDNIYKKGTTECSKVVSLSAGCEHSAAILEDGSLYTWGHGEVKNIKIILLLIDNNR